ncbi:MFS transporter [Kitasatospora cineracea]|uniref:MFS transporter n=1 Tax=Kitasatospora cineracea TaxID=88074 RepID=UPI0037FEB927
MLRVLGSGPAFRRLWIGQFTSDLGSSVTTLAMPLLAVAATGSAGQAGLLGSLAFLTTWLAALPAGQLADRYRPRSLLLACDAGRLAAAVAVVVAVAAGSPPLWLLALVTVVNSALTVAFGPASGKLLRVVVPEEQLPEAVSVNLVRGYAASITGPALGGVLFALGRALPFVADALSYVVSLAAVRGLPPGPAPARTGPAGDPGGPGTAGGRPRRWPTRAELGRGLVLLRGSPFLRCTVGYGLVANFAVTMLFSALLLRPRAGSGGVGISLGAAAAAGLTGSVLAPWLLRRLGLPRLMLAVCLVRMLAVAGAALVGGPVAFGAALAAVLLLGPVAGAAISATTLLAVDYELYGRVSGASAFVGGALQPLAPLAAGLLVQGVGAGGTLAVVAGLFLLCAAVVLAGRSALAAGAGAGRVRPAPGV